MCVMTSSGSKKAGSVAVPPVAGERNEPFIQASSSALRTAVNMPSANTSILKKPRMSRSSLSQGTTVRSVIRAGSTGETS